MPVGPLMNSEYYPGWLTHWSEEIQQVSTERVVFTLQDMLNNNIHFNFYMFFGGTNFEFSAGTYVNQFNRFFYNDLYNWTISSYTPIKCMYFNLYKTLGFYIAFIT